MLSTTLRDITYDEVLYNIVEHDQITIITMTEYRRMVMRWKHTGDVTLQRYYMDDDVYEVQLKQKYLNTEVYHTFRSRNKELYNIAVFHLEEEE